MINENSNKLEIKTRSFHDCFPDAALQSSLRAFRSGLQAADVRLPKAHIERCEIPETRNEKRASERLTRNDK